MTDGYRISASIFAADSLRLGDEARNVVTAGADWIHLDVIDNHYAPNMGFGSMVCHALRKHIDAPIDVHLMVSPVDAVASEFAKAGASHLTFHPDASIHVHRTVQLIAAQGCKVGLAFNPGAPLSQLEWLIDQIDLIHIMSVSPGFGGQKFIDNALRKIEVARRLIDASGRDIRLQVDGGIKMENIRRIADAGADTFVVGSAIFDHANYTEVLSGMRRELNRVR